MGYIATTNRYKTVAEAINSHPTKAPKNMQTHPLSQQKGCIQKHHQKTVSSHKTPTQPPRSNGKKQTCHFREGPGALES